MKQSGDTFTQSEIESMDDGEVLDRMLTCGFRLSVWRTEIRRRLDAARNPNRQSALEMLGQAALQLDPNQPIHRRDGFWLRIAELRSLEEL